MTKVTGIGGIFFKSTGDRAALAEWYSKHLGMPLESFGGAIFRWPNDPAPDKGVTVWHVADAGSKWFSPSTASFMINYRVDDLDKMVTALRAGGVEIAGGPESHENGKFAWVLDPDGNKIELWQPVPSDEEGTQSESRQERALSFLQHLRAGDRAAAVKLVTDTARHHNPYFAAGMANLIDAAVAAATTAPDRTAEVQRVIEGGDFVTVHSHVRHRPGDPGVSVVHIFRFEDDRIAELWDVGQPVPPDNPNADGMF